MGKFTFIETKLAGLYIVEPRVHRDARGYFLESYNRADFHDAGLTMDFVQDNESRSTRGVLRGMHFQIKHPQGKLVRVTHGEVFDVAVDIRPGSPTYKQWEGVYLSEENKHQLYIPPGFAHGFLVISDVAEFCYKCSEFYRPDDEGSLKWNDPEVDIAWPISDGMEVVLSAKDK
jgi:dTDP-4-dehydrorhamnose 3,5-epimerase